MTNNRRDVETLPTVALNPHEALDRLSPGQEAGLGLSQELIDRARIGWERFVASIEEASDD
ncbi:hypothetical protein [Streptomyces sp. NPDC059564]|uniref:hypothetical protein n=1 Tax=Streptomyces sp. NPDC059564 TaxID=3346865 RepID=UPI0036B41940